MGRSQLVLACSLTADHCEVHRPGCTVHMKHTHIVEIPTRPQNRTCLAEPTIEAKRSTYQALYYCPDSFKMKIHKTSQPPPNNLLHSTPPRPHPHTARPPNPIQMYSTPKTDLSFNPSTSTHAHIRTNQPNTQSFHPAFPIG